MPLEHIIHVHIAKEFRRSLAARLSGQADHPALLRRLANQSDRAVLLLDFSEVAVMTSSYWGGAFAPLWRLEPQAPIPVVINATDAVADELELICRNGFNCWSAEYDTGQISKPKVLGSIEPSLEVTLTALLAAPNGLTGADLERAQPNVAATAWNNRLVSLAEKRLVSRKKNGRKVVYSTPWSGEINGH